MRRFHGFANEADREWRFMDGSLVKAHQHSAGASSPSDEAIGNSRGGRTSKIHMAVDAFGLPIVFKLSGAQVNGCTVAPEWIDELPPGGAVIADKGYDSEALRTQIRERQSVLVIPRRDNSTIGNEDRDCCLYKYRHLVENVFARLKQFRSIATRYDKLERNYLGMLALACSFLCLPM